MNTQEYTGCEFLKPLVHAMMASEPKKRPKIREVNERYSQIIESLHWWQIRSRVIPQEESTSKRIVNNVRWLFRTIGHLTVLKSGLPKPR